ncbi:hypothetical protein Tco_0168464, partial [Tanacetum coccineum]
LEGDEEKLDDVLFELESSHDELVTPYDATARNGRNKRPCTGHEFDFYVSQERREAESNPDRTWVDEIL